MIFREIFIILTDFVQVTLA